MSFDFSSNSFFNFVNSLSKTNEFLNLYRYAIFNESESTYDLYTKYVSYKISQFKSINMTDTSTTQLKLYLINQNGKCMYNSHCNHGNYNSYSRYKSSKILMNLNMNTCTSKFILNKNGVVIGLMTAEILSKNNGIKMTEQSTGMKKIVYAGYWMNYDQLNSFVNTSHSNGVTHICLEFAQLVPNDQGELTQITYLDTVNAWMCLSESERTNIINSMNSKGMKLMLSFGGANTFKIGGADSILSSPTYSNSLILAQELVNHCKLYKYHGIDLDIEHFPTIYEYADTDKLVAYFGQLSQQIKEQSSSIIGYPIIVSHAPQSPYFNGPTDSSQSLYGYVYSKIEKQYGWYIDFYNIQYYNQGIGLYENYETIFYNDTSFNASVNQLIYGGDINSNYAYVDPAKIVVGKVSNYNEGNSGGYVQLYNSQVTSSNCMAGIIEATKYDQDRPQIVNWSSVGGIMVWYYNVESSSTSGDNKNVLDYFNYVDDHL